MPEIPETKPLSKKTSHGDSRISRLGNNERTPPHLSEKLIAQLQGAVEAAQRRRARPQRSMTSSDADSSPVQGGLTQFRSEVRAVRATDSDSENH